MTFYDIFGDVHGRIDLLQALLSKMGYSLVNGVWAHPSRTAIFVGDLIDRGPEQLKTVRLVKSMVETGSALAVLGNHELNAMGWVRPDPNRPGDFLRSHNKKRILQHARLLKELENDRPFHAEMIDWFHTLPLWLDLPGFRVVHACWNGDYIKKLSAVLGPENRLTVDMLPEAYNKGGTIYKEVDCLVCGVEVDLPDNQSYLDNDGFPRRTVRVAWWDGAGSYRQRVLMSAEQRAMFPDDPLPINTLVSYDEQKPLFIGHYWARGEHKVLNAKMACVDYSANTVGGMVAYRWDGESELSNDKFIGV